LSVNVGLVEVYELAHGLWRWTAWHEEANQHVGCVYYERGGEVCLFDPQLPPEDPDRFWAALDHDVERAGGHVHVLLTVGSEPRSAAEIVERYGARLWGNGDPLPGGVEGFDAGRPGDFVFWIPEHRALVTGDFERREALRPLLSLDVELILVSRGEPVLECGGEALRRLLAG
jgi:hypothetical protein